MAWVSVHILVRTVRMLRQPDDDLVYLPSTSLLVHPFRLVTSAYSKRPT
jgi:hypothetical protein